MLYIANGLSYSLLRPETVESLYYAHYVSQNSTYREQGLAIWNRMKENAWLDESGTSGSGFCSIADVTVRPNAEKICPMQTFVLAETLTYLYLLFKPDSEKIIDLRKWVFNTEAHPLPRWTSNAGVGEGKCDAELGCDPASGVGGVESDVNSAHLPDDEFEEVVWHLASEI